jgi:hypothetical protein
VSGRWVAAFFGLVAVTLAAGAGVEVRAERGATVQPKGPRAGAPGTLYFNVEGKNNGEQSAFACFGVLDFRPEKPAAPLKVKGLTLRLTQSLAQFSKDGPVKVYLSRDTATPVDREGSPLKFDVKAADGLGDQLKPVEPLGSADFTKRKTGEADSLDLSPSGEARAYLADRLNRGETIRLVVVPASDDVAATYFGPAADDPAQRPSLTIDAAP